MQVTAYRVFLGSIEGLYTGSLWKIWKSFEIQSDHLAATSCPIESTDYQRRGFRQVSSVIRRLSLVMACLPVNKNANETCGPTRLLSYYQGVPSYHLWAFTAVSTQWVLLTYRLGPAANAKMAVGSAGLTSRIGATIAAEQWSDFALRLRTLF